MQWSAIIWAGFISSTLATALLWAFRNAGLVRYTPAAQVGTFLLPNPRARATEAVGLVAILVAGTTLAPLLYMLLLAPFGVSWVAGAALGAVFGAAHLGSLPYLAQHHAGIQRGLVSDPGRFGVEWGRATPGAIVLAHVTYGAVLCATVAAFQPAV